MDIFLIQSIGPIEIGPIRSKNILIKRLKANQILFAHRYKILNQVSPLRLIHHIHFETINNLALQLFDLDHLRIVSLSVHIKLVVFLLAFELVAVDELVALLLDFCDALLLLLLDSFAQLLFLLFVSRHK
jgi:hypothetical protein